MIADIDECASNPCDHGICYDQENGFECKCRSGWEGDFCDTDIDECASDPCINGQCIDGENHYTCVCTPGFTGANCESGKIFY